MGLVRGDSESQPAQVLLEPDAETLLSQLVDPDMDLRRVAALGLDGVTDAVPALLDRLAIETEATVRDAVLTTLCAYDTEAVAAALAPHLASDDAGLRAAVAEALAVMPSSVLSLMPGLLADADHDVRIMTVLVLDGLKLPEAAFWLGTIIRDDPHPNVVTAAIGALLPSATPEYESLFRLAMQRFPDDLFLRFIVDMTTSRLAMERL